MIELEAVHKRFTSGPAPGRAPRTVVALRDVTLSVPAGGVWAVVGPNGAGKTTLFALVLGFLRPDEGTVRVGGREPRSWIRRNGAGYLPERFTIPPRWKVLPALRALARLEGLDAADADRRARASLERFGLERHAEKTVGSLSRGLTQRLGLAQALLADRDLVVLDEPTEGLDPLWRIRFRAVVGGLRREGRTVLIASHDLAEVERMADRAVLLDDGNVREVLDARPADGARTRYRLDLATATPAVADAFPGGEAVPDTAGTSYLVDAADAKELSGRLAALIAAGGVIASVRPLTEPLEERVQRALDGGE